jgi:hypothetical protein
MHAQSLWGAEELGYPRRLAAFRNMQSHGGPARAIMTYDFEVTIVQRDEGYYQELRR